MQPVIMVLQEPSEFLKTIGATANQDRPTVCVCVCGNVRGTTCMCVITSVCLFCCGCYIRLILLEQHVHLQVVLLD